MAGDWMQTLRKALGAILNPDGPQSTAGTLMNLMGRSTILAVEWNALELVPGDVGLPLLLVQFLPVTQTGADGDTRRGTVQFTALAEGNNAQAVADNILGRVEQLLTATALLAQGVDASPVGFWRRLTLPQDRQFTRALHRSDAETDLEGMQVPATL